MNGKLTSARAATIVGTLGFAAAAVVKLFKPDVMSAEFLLFGLPAWTIPAVAVLELIGVAFVYTPQRRAGAALLAIVGAGAVVEHVSHGQAAMAVAPFVLAALVVIGVVLQGTAGRTAQQT